MRPILRTHTLLGVSLLTVCACAPSTPAGTEKTNQARVGMLEDMVYGHFTTFELIEILATEEGIDLESTRSADWPTSGFADVSFGSSVVGTEFSVDRTDFEEIGRTWSVNLSLNPMVAAGNNTTGELSGKWEYWVPGSEADADGMGWVEITLTGTVVSPSEPGGAPTDIYAVVNENGQIYEAEVIHGSETKIIAP